MRMACDAHGLCPRVDFVFELFPIVVEGIELFHSKVRIIILRRSQSESLLEKIFQEGQQYLDPVMMCTMNFDAPHIPMMAVSRANFLVLF